MIKGRFFKFWAYTVSHKTLFLRSEMQMPDLEYQEFYVPNCTIDIEFTGVESLKIDTGFTIDRIEITNTSRNYEEDVKLFNLHHIDGNVSQIVATSCVIGKSDWISEHRIQDLNLEYPEILNGIIEDGRNE